MAWHTEIYIHSASSQATVFADLCDFIENVCGWTLHDNISSTEKVFYTTGESGTRTQEYLMIWLDSTYIYFRAYLYWDEVAHAGYGGAYYSSNYSRIAANGSGVHRFYGNENLVVYYCPVGEWFYGGHIGADGDVSTLTETSLTAGASAGSSVALTVASTEGFIAGYDVTILDETTGMRDSVEVASVDSATQLTVTTLPNDYTSGSRIGWWPSRFGIASSSMSAGPARLTSCPPPGGTSSSSYYNQYGAKTPFEIESPSFAGLYGVCPVYYAGADGISGKLNVGYETHLCDCGRTEGSNILVNDNRQYPVLTATGGSVATVVDTTQTWTTNEHAGKVVGIVGGAGVNQTRVIASNTSDTLTLRDNLQVAAASGSNFVIADKSYFVMHVNQWAVLENEEP